MKRIAAILGVLAVGAIGGLLGQASGAQAAQRTVTSDKTLYAASNLTFTGGVADAPSTGAPTTVLRIRVTAPSAGMAVISLDSQWWTDFPANPGSSPLYASASLGRCSASNTLSTTVCNFIEPLFQQKAPYNNSGSDITEPFSMNALMPFAHGGTKTLSLNVSAYGYPTGFYSGAHTQVSFTPAHPIATSNHVSVQVFQ